MEKKEGQYSQFECGRQEIVHGRNTFHGFLESASPRST